MSRRIPVFQSRGKSQGLVRCMEGGKVLTGESRIDPTRLMLIRRMKRFPICFIISLLGNYNHHRERKERKIISKTCEKNLDKRFRREATHANFPSLGKAFGDIFRLLDCTHDEFFKQ